MRDALSEAKERLARKIDSHSTPSIKPMGADPWVVSSLLQKSIRRGETEIAQRAALTLCKFKGAAIWRHLTVIAFEDVGIGDLTALTTTVAVGSDSAWRKRHGGDWALAVQLAGTLAEAPKDRSADYLCQAKDHPALDIDADK
jgi:replication-associated recombination protein RarA